MAIRKEETERRRFVCSECGALSGQACVSASGKERTQAHKNRWWQVMAMRKVS